MTSTQGTEPTQVRRPWRATTRTVFQALIGLAVILPVMVQAAGLDPATIPWLGGVLAIAAAVARIMAVPTVELWLRSYFPWLAAQPRPKLDPGETGAVAVELRIIAACVLLGCFALLLL